MTKSPLGVSEVADGSMHQLAGQLESILSRHPRIREWRLNLADAKSVKLGIDSNRLGGPYSAPRSLEQLVGEVYIVWDDGRRSAARVDPECVNDSGLVDGWRAVSFNDTDLVPVLDPMPLNMVEVFSPEVDEAVRNQGGALFAPLARYGALKAVARYVSASVSASSTRNLIRSSAGHNVAFSETHFSTSVSLDSVYRDSWAGRRLAAEAELESMVAGTVTRYGQLGRPARGWLSSSAMDVVLEPEVVQDLAGHYLLNNLLGSNVANGQSAFKPNDFGHRRIARPDFSLWLEPTRPLHAGSYVCTKEGVPADRLCLIDGGVLASPTLDVKYAIRLGLKPTALANGSESLALKVPLVAPDDVMSGPGAALLVCLVLGMHTQDATSGNFSLTAGQALEISESGEIGGKVKAVISGNFFEALSDPETRFASVPGKDFPMMRMKCRVNIG